MSGGVGDAAGRHTSQYPVPLTLGLVAMDADCRPPGRGGSDMRTGGGARGQRQGAGPSHSNIPVPAQPTCYLIDTVLGLNKDDGLKEVAYE